MLTAELVADARCPGRARRIVEEALVDLRCSDEVVQSAKLLVSELVTNVVLHARCDGLAVAIDQRGACIRIAVRDGSQEVPALRQVRDGDLHGRGMHLVDALAERWGVDPVEPSGKTVWFELPLAEAQPS